jgi:hypothetical protein
MPGRQQLPLIGIPHMAGDDPGRRLSPLRIASTNWSSMPRSTRRPVSLITHPRNGGIRLHLQVSRGYLTAAACCLGGAFGQRMLTSDAVSSVSA